MKKCFLLIFCAMPFAIQAQQVLTNAVVKARIETSSDNSGAGSGDGGGGMVIQMAGSETDIVGYFKDSMRKVSVKNNFMNSITLYDGNTGVSTILTESMGEKTGYTQNDMQRLEQRRRSDSIMKAREGEEGSGPGRMVIRMGGGANEKTTDISYSDESKKINGLDCKKAVVTTQGNDGTEKKTDVWYCPAYKLPAGINLGRGMMNLAELKGMPVLYERSNTINVGGNEIIMTTRYEVTSVETGKKIEDKEFELPKGYKVKTWEEYLKENPDGMPNMRRTIRIGG
jgi:hypothetical protein